MKIYFLGGSFDPPHLGHLRIAEYFSKKCDLFLFIPAKKSPFKRYNPIASSLQRLHMLALLTEKVKKSKIETFELDGTSPSYTYLTIKYIKKKYSSNDLNMIIGKDNLNGLNKWKNFKFITQNCNIICVNRNIKESDSLFYPKNISFVDFDENVSSSMIKDLLKSSQYLKTKKMIDKNVLDYIRDNNLYK